MLGLLVKSFINKNCHNSRTSNNIDMKLGPVTKIDKETQKRQKKLTMTLCQQIMMSSSFMVDL